MPVSMDRERSRSICVTARVRNRQKIQGVASLALGSGLSKLLQRVARHRPHGILCLVLKHAPGASLYRLMGEVLCKPIRRFDEQGMIIVIICRKPFCSARFDLIKQLDSSKAAG
jgi:hypothetical protein